MCGIVGYAGSSLTDGELQPILREACLAIAHRGPDEQGIYHEKGVALGISRLAIRDPAKATQPMTRRGTTLVFNGELYETEILKKDLQEKGYVFETKGDTEIFLCALIEYGPSIVASLSGMFAFALWSEETRTLHLGRDRWGEKPLFYAFGEEYIVFSSEIKALRPFPCIRWEIALDDIGAFLRHSYIPAPRTGWTNVFKLEPGMILAWRQGKMSKSKYFAPLPVPNEQEKDVRSQSQELFHRLRSSVHFCAVSDKPVGVFLSGGIDSTTVACLLARDIPHLKAFSIDWEEQDYSECHYAMEAASQIGLQHHRVKCDHRFFIDHFDALVKLYDEPFADESMFPTYCLSKYAKQHVDVVLTGDGADELFHGYERYFFRGPLKEYFDVFSAMNRKTRELVCRGELLSCEDDTHLYTLLETLKKENIDLGPDRIKSWIDMRIYLADDILTKVDRAAMGTGLEARAPFLTPPVADFALGCANSLLIGHQNRGKEILREAMGAHLPSFILNRKKMGFGMPIQQWFRGPLQQWMIHRLTKGTLLQTPWFSKRGIEQLIHLHLSGSNYSRAILNLLVLEAWFNTVF